MLTQMQHDAVEQELKKLIGRPSMESFYRRWLAALDIWAVRYALDTVAMEALIASAFTAMANPSQSIVHHQLMLMSGYEDYLRTTNSELDLFEWAVLRAMASRGVVNAYWHTARNGAKRLVTVRH